MNRNITRRAGTALIIIGLVLSVVSLGGMAMADKPTIDTETTDTSTTSEIKEGYTINPFEANRSNSSYLEAEFDSDNPQVRAVDPENAEVLRRWGEGVMNETNASNNYYRLQIRHDQLENAPMEPGESKDVDIVVINNTNVSESEWDTTTATITLNNSDDRTVVRAGDSAFKGPNVRAETAARWGFSIVNNTPAATLLTYSVTEFEQEQVKISGSGSTVTFAADNTTVEQAFDEESDKVDAGEFSPGIITTVSASDGSRSETIPVYAEEAPESVENGESYGVYETSNNTLKLTLGDNWEDVEEADVSFMATDRTSTQILAHGFTYFTEGGAPLMFMGGVGAMAFGIPLRIRGRNYESTSSSR